LKGSFDGVHILERDEAAGLWRLQREQEPKRPHVFTSERGQAFTLFAINKMIEAAGRNAGIERRLRPHCLRHTSGSVLVNGGMSAWHPQKHLGHANMSNTIGHVRMSPELLKDVWRGRRQEDRCYRGRVLS
jgi:site-specific recombinase XerD